MNDFNTNYSINDNSLNVVEDVQLSFSIATHSFSTDYENSETLGQVFTLPKIASFMVNLLAKYNQEQLKILDPCIGPNTFPNVIEKIIPKAQITGIELDNRLINNTIKHFYKQEYRELIEGSFFDYSISEKFDAVIQNPPYVRHELLRIGANSKENISNALHSLNVTIPSKSNLYIYFLLKSILHLKENGKLVAITYDSWLYSDFGLFLKKTLFRLGQIENVYHFKKNAFPDANVGATIIEFTKKSKSKNNNFDINYFQFETPNELEEQHLIPTFKLNKLDFLSFKGNAQTVLNFKTSLFTTIRKISTFKPYRGIGTIANPYFIFDTPRFGATVPLIKEVTKIKTMSAGNATKHLLCVNGHRSEALTNYLIEVTKEAENNPKFLTLSNTIKQNKYWYKIQLKPTGNIIFNYYLRENIDFILNINNLQISDNFYVIRIQDEYLYPIFAILNSTFSKIAILEHSRNQGSGLRKIQMFEFLEVPIINIHQLDKSSIKLLAALGKKLSFSERYTEAKKLIIKEIDNVLLPVYNKFNQTCFSIENIENEYNSALKF